MVKGPLEKIREDVDFLKSTVEAFKATLNEMQQTIRSLGIWKRELIQQIEKTFDSANSFIKTVAADYDTLETRIQALEDSSRKIRDSWWYKLFGGK